MTKRPYDWLQRHPWVTRAFLAPSAVSADPTGPTQRNDMWICFQNADGSPRLQNCTTGHFFDPSPEDVVGVTPTPQGRFPRDGLQYVQVRLRRVPVMFGDGRLEFVRSRRARSRFGRK